MRAIRFEAFQVHWRAMGFLMFVFALSLPLQLIAGEPVPASPAAATDQPPKLSVSGKVLDKDSHPVAKAKVLLREWSTYRRGEDPFSPVRDILATTTTDDKGQFSFRDVASRPFKQPWPESAPWDVIVQAEGYGLAWYHVSAPTESSPVTIKVTPEAKVSGQVLDAQGKPVAGAKVAAEEVAPLGSPMSSDVIQPDRLDLGLSEVAPTVQTDAQGHFQIGGLPAMMRITLVVRHEDFVRQPAFVGTTSQAQPDLVSNFVADGKPQSISFPVYTGPFTLKLQPGCRLTGHVTYTDTKKPCGQARIGASGPSWYSATADAEGRFVITGLPTAQYSLLVYPPEDANYLVRQMAVTLAQGEKNKELAIALEPGLAVTGKVIADDTHAGVEGIEVYYRSEVVQGGTERSLARAGMTDKQGAFRLVVPPGKAELILSGPVPHYNVPEWHFSDPTPDSRFVRPITVEAGKPLAGIEFAVTRGLVIGGVVTDPKGQPVGGAGVYPVREGNTDSESQSALTDEAGRFVLSGFPPADAPQLLVIHPERKLIGTTQVEAGREDAPTRTVSVKVQLQAAANATGLVLLSGKPLAGAQVTLLNFRTEKEQRYATAGDSTTTDEKGRYQFEMLEPGEEYAVALHQPGYTQEQSTAFKPTPGQNVEVTAMEPLQADRSVGGTVVDPEGKPIEGAMVTAMHRDGRTIGGAFTQQPTGKDGRFKIDYVPNVPMSVAAYVPPAPGAAAVPAVISPRVNVEPGQTDVRIRLDTKQSNVPAESSAPAK